MQEDASLLDALLRFCYPVEPPKITNQDDFERVAGAAQKFEMESLYGRIVDSFISNNIVYPSEQYILAHRFKLHQLAIDSAEKCLDYSLSELVGQAQTPDITYLSARNYNRLLQYHRAYCDACTRLVDGRDFSWCHAEKYAFVVCPCADNDETMGIDIEVGGERGLATVSWRKWWFNHVSRIEEAMEARGPSAVNHIDVSQAAADVIASGCQRCRDAAIVELHDFGRALRWEVKNKRRMERIAVSELFVENCGDIILRSSDRVDFHVYKCIVLVASPIFRDMFSLPDSPAANLYQGTKPVIDMAETSFVLNDLLRFCYPVDTPKLYDKDHFQKIAAAAQKFEMSSAYGRIVDSYITCNAPVPPLEKYVLAHRFNLHQLAKDSARECLDYSLSDIVGQARLADLTYISTIEFNRLLQYHHDFCKACEKLVDGEDFSWLDSAEEYTFVTCDCIEEGQESFNHGVDLGNLNGIKTAITWRKWWFGHIRRIKEDIAARGVSAIDHIDVSQAAMEVIASDCQKCREGAIQELHDFTAALRWQVKSEKTKAFLEINF
ncbi:hypothetical protein EYR36_001582 [Pleurotus pulmonarius]|nr:hypothetical protein EYR36_001582 [Pleurotus pulmonarius]